MSPTHTTEAGWDAADRVRAMIASRPTHPGGAAGQAKVHVDATWVAVSPDQAPLSDSGWKLHISSRAATFPELADRLVPVLLARGCHFKLARSVPVLARINDGALSPALVGKAVTIYPDRRRIRELGLALADLLRGHAGPRVLSDRRVAEDAPVYYRYGPFQPRWYVGERGGLAIRIAGPDGDMFEGVASLEYRRPAWTTDPFTGESGTHTGPPDGAGTEVGEADGPLLGDRYRVTTGIFQSARGNVYRAADLTTGRQVVVKQARAHTGEDLAGADSRIRLRNERRLLAACRDVPGTPEYLDHFTHGPDEYLVISDVGRLNLLQRVRTRGSYLGGGTDPGALAGFAQLAAELAQTVSALHDRGVVMRDLTPRNVVLGDDRAYLIDFGISALDGFHLSGGTPGFAPARQLRDEPPTPGDDCYALGAVLAFAAIGMVPVLDPATPELARQRILQGLTAARGRHCPGLLELIGDLLSGEPGPAADAVRTLADPGWPDNPPGRRARPPVTLPSVTPDLLEALERRSLDLILERIDAHLLAEPDSAIGSVDAGIHTGSAGVGLELLHYRDHPGVPEVLRGLASHAAGATARVDLPLGLFTGVAGVELFLARMAAAGYQVPDAAPGVDDGTDPGDEIMSGLAGLGLVELLRYDLDQDPARLAAACGLAGRILDRPQPQWTAELSAGLPPESGVDATFGYAHGLAGVVDFLVGVASRTGDPDLATAAHRYAHRLAGNAAERAAAAARATAVPITASWCQGLAGAARALQHAATFLDEPGLSDAALMVADTCAGWLPRMENLSQCCGASGVGSALVEVAIGSSDERPWAAARRAARHLLVRSFEPDDRPAFVNLDRQDAPLSWGMGGIGVLAFLRRLNHPDTPDLLPGPPPAAAR